jgi:hypothetical protein
MPAAIPEGRWIKFHWDSDRLWNIMWFSSMQFECVIRFSGYCIQFNCMLDLDSDTMALEPWVNLRQNIFWKWICLNITALSKNQHHFRVFASKTSEIFQKPVTIFVNTNNTSKVLLNQDLWSKIVSKRFWTRLFVEWVHKTEGPYMTKSFARKFSWVQHSCLRDVD